MYRNVIIEIFGASSEADALWKVIDTLEEDACEHQWGRAADTTDILASMRSAVDGGGMAVFMKSDTGRLFNDTREACRDAGLHYIVSYGPADAQGFTEAIFYRAGGEEFTIPLDVGNEVIPLRDIREATKQGLDAVQAVIDEYDRKTLKDIEKTFSVPEELMETLEASIPYPM